MGMYVCMDKWLNEFMAGWLAEWVGSQWEDV